MRRLQSAAPFFVVCALGFACLGASPVPALPTPSDAVTIYNPGNADYAGYRIVVRPTGEAVAVDAAGRASSLPQPDIVDRFFGDLRTGAPSAREARCAASSVGSAVTISWSGHRWSGFDCLSDPHAASLLDDAVRIQRSLYVQAYRTATIEVWTSGERSYASYSPVGYTPASPYPLGIHFGSSMSGLPGASPYSGLQTTGITGGLPTASVTGSLPTASLPAGSVQGSMTTSSPFGSSPFSSSPFSSP